MREDRLPEPRPPGPPLAELTLRPVVPALCLAELHHLSGTSACSTPTAISFGAKFGSFPFSRICGVYRQGHLSSLMSPRNVHSRCQGDTESRPAVIADTGSNYNTTALCQQGDRESHPETPPLELLLDSVARSLESFGKDLNCHVDVG